MKTQDELLGLARPVGSREVHDAVAGGTGRAHAEAPRRVQAPQTRRAHRGVPREQPRDRGGRIRWSTRSAPTGHPHPQLVANGMIATVDDPVLGHTTQVGVPIHLRGHARRDPGPAADTRSAQRRDLRRARLLAPPRSPAFSGGELMHALEGVRLIDFGQYLAGPVRPDGHRRSRRRRDQGRAGHR